MERKRELSEKYTRDAMLASTKHAFWRNWHRWMTVAETTLCGREILVDSEQRIAHIFLELCVSRCI